MQGNLLDDTELIGVLAVTKSAVAQVNQKLQGASDTTEHIREACEEYRPVAKRAQILYFLIMQFSVVNCMYQTSLSQVSRHTLVTLVSENCICHEYLTHPCNLSNYKAAFANGSSLILFRVTQFDQLYGLAIDKAEKAILPHKRIENINERLTYDIYSYFQRGLFEAHKMVFGLMLAFAILVAAGKVNC